MPQPFDAVLLISFGGPQGPDDIRPFLANVLRGRRVPPERVEEVAHHYDLFGGVSPITEITRRQAAGLSSRLVSAGHTLPVYVGMRNWHPFLPETLAAMAARGHRRALAIVLSAFRTEASWDRYVADVAAARAGTPGAPDIVFAEPWYAHPGYVGAVADGIASTLGAIPVDERLDAPLVFTAHSVPVAMASASPYVADFTAAARAVAGRLDRRRWSLAYQSRSGSPHEPWLEPDVGDTIATLAREGARHVVVSPIGFVCDHVEVLYDLDVEARRRAAEHGLTLHRAPAVNAHPQFVAMLAELVPAASSTDAAGIRAR